MSRETIRCPRCKGAGTVQESSGWPLVWFFFVMGLLALALASGASWEREILVACLSGVCGVVFLGMSLVGCHIETQDDMQPKLGASHE